MAIKKPLGIAEAVLSLWVNFNYPKGYILEKNKCYKVLSISYIIHIFLFKMSEGCWGGNMKELKIFVKHDIKGKTN
jgi:hypothetical protein